MEYKDFVSRICELYDLEFNEKDSKFILDISRGRYSSLDENITLCEGELEETFNRLSEFNFKSGSMYNMNKYETIVQEEISPRQYEYIPDIKDSQNDINYSVSFISDSMIIFLFINIFDNMDTTLSIKRQSRLFRHPLRMLLKRLEEGFKGNDITSIIDFIRLMMRPTFSLKIETINAKEYSRFVDLKNAYIFNTLYMTDNILIEYTDFESIMKSTNSFRRNGKSELEIEPRRKYDEIIVNYYKKGMASSDPYIQFISFYHVLEYFYDETYNKYLVKDLRNKLTHPEFSYKNDEDLLKVASFTYSRLKQFGEDGQGNELESLKYVLKEFIDINMLKNKLDSTGITDGNYYKNTDIKFSNGPKIIWDNSEGVITNIAKRIYYTRNSLVHSKSGRKNLMYHPYKNEEDLKNEIPLVKSIAEFVIIESAELL